MKGCGLCWTAALSFPSSPSAGFASSYFQRPPVHSSSSFSSSSSNFKANLSSHQEEEEEGAVDLYHYETSKQEDRAKLPFASTYHAPVMWKECIEALLDHPRRQQQKNWIFVDGTLGGGGHSEALLQRLEPGDVVFGCDVDPNALETATKRLEAYLQVSEHRPLFVPVQSNFAQLSTILPTIQYPDDSKETIMGDHHSVDGILLDLGVSSHQIDTPERGFAFMTDGPLDMRMMTADTTKNSGSVTTTTASVTAADLCNEMEEYELTQILKRFGDEPRAKAIAKSIIQHRPLSTTGQLQQAVAAVIPAFDKRSKRKGRTSTLARVFQALRIVVNQEDRVLQQVLEQVSPKLLREGGRLVVLSYHSMEDRAVKRVMRDGSIAKQRGSPERDAFGNHIGPAKPFRPVGKFLKASEEEVANNSRARSATLRIAERLEVVTEDTDDEDR